MPISSTLISIHYSQPSFAVQFSTVWHHTLL